MKPLLILLFLITGAAQGQTILQSIDSNKVPLAARNYVLKENAKYFSKKQQVTWYRDAYTEDTIHYIYSAHYGKEGRYTNILHFDSLAQHVSKKFLSAEAPPKAVAEAFKAMYPDAREVYWMFFPPMKAFDSATFHWPNRDSLYMAHFNVNVNEISLLFSPNGKCKYSHLTLPNRFLASDISAYLGTHYHKYKIYLWGRYIDASNNWTYIVSLKKGWLSKKSYDATFDGNGKFVKIERGEFRTAHEDRIDSIGNFFFPAWQQLTLK
jgi:hypothetical protein